MWLIFPYSNNTYGNFNLNSTGYVYHGNGVDNAYRIAPVVYLKQNTKLTGTGTSTDMYKIS